MFLKHRILQKIEKSRNKSKNNLKTKKLNLKRATEHGF